jgi:CubicO group peptidase (beta-lactamase class C family)
MHLCVGCDGGVTAQPAQIRRRALLAGPLLASACAAPFSGRGSPFLYRDGIGSRSDGPMMPQLGTLGGGFATANRGNWWQPAYSVDSFSRLDGIWPAARVTAPAQASPLRRRAREPDIGFDGAPVHGLGRFSLDDYLSRNPTTGLLIIRDGEILVERYQYARNDQHRLTSFSMAKTLVALLIGLALEEGHIGSIEQTAGSIVPELLGCEYGATPLRHLLTMSSGVAFRETYDGRDDSAGLSRLTFGGQSAGGVAVPPFFNTRIAAPGRQWNYASAETFVLALALRRAIGRPIADYFAEKLWQPLGAEADSSWLTDLSGLEIGFMGFNAVLRDYGRLAMLLASGGQHGGRQLLPQAWLAEMTRPHFTGAETGRWFGYGLQTWVIPVGQGEFALLGSRGQAILVDPSRRLALVHTAVRSTAIDPGGADLAALWRGVKRHV